MRTIIKVVISVFAVIVLFAASITYFQGKNFELLSTAGEIGHRERNLMLFTVALSLVVIIPVFTMTYHITRKYRSNNPKARYTPDWDGNRTLETIWWSIPLVLIIILASVTWITSHSLDPRKPIQSNQAPIKIQVIALDWKWLFIYPDKNIATVNYVVIPEQRSIEFNITSDAPMNSFSIPQLGGQIYAMSGMSNKLHLMADHTGTYRGQSANLSGEGFAGMTFSTYSVTQSDYDQWSASKVNSPAIDYPELAKKSKNVKPETYSTANAPMLYNSVLEKYVKDKPESR